MEISYKNGRTMTQYKSILCKVEHGVPQGSILGPLLFNIFVNDLPHYLSENITVYADDTSVVIAADSVRDLESKMISVLTKMHNWYTENKLVINVDKTNIILFNTINNFDSILFQNRQIKLTHSAKY